MEPLLRSLLLDRWRPDEKKDQFMRMMAVAVFIVSWVMMSHSTVNAQERLRYSRSSQVTEAFGKEALDLFEKVVRKVLNEKEES